MMYSEGAQLRHEILKAGLSEAKVAQKLGVSKSSLSRWCSGEVEPSGAKQAALHRLFPALPAKWRPDNEKPGQGRAEPAPSQPKASTRSEPTPAEFTERYCNGLSLLSTYGLFQGRLLPGPELARQFADKLNIPIESWTQPAKVDVDVADPPPSDIAARTLEAVGLRRTIESEAQGFSVALAQCLPRTAAPSVIAETSAELAAIFDELVNVSRGAMLDKSCVPVMTPDELTHFIFGELDKCGARQCAGLLFELGSGHVILSEAKAA
jgi:transcriptional regulator with XRE-family HTH domain